MWKLSEDHCKKIATEKSETCLFTLTDYNKNWSRDNLLIQILKKNYNNLVFFLKDLMMKNIYKVLK